MTAAGFRKTLTRTGESGKLSVPGASAHAAARMRVQARQRRAGHAGGCQRRSNIRPLGRSNSRPFGHNVEREGETTGRLWRIGD